MATFVLTMETGNDATLTEDGRPDFAALAAYLRHVAAKLEDFENGNGHIIDGNGNRIGSYSLTEGE